MTPGTNVTFRAQQTVPQALLQQLKGGKQTLRLPRLKMNETNLKN
jgi:hypothetical protein